MNHIPCNCPACAPNQCAKCGEEMKIAPGIGPYCQNPSCENVDGPAREGAPTGDPQPGRGREVWVTEDSKTGRLMAMGWQKPSEWISGNPAFRVRMFVEAPQGAPSPAPAGDLATSNATYKEHIASMAADGLRNLDAIAGIPGKNAGQFHLDLIRKDLEAIVARARKDPDGSERFVAHYRYLLDKERATPGTVQAPSAGVREVMELAQASGHDVSPPAVQATNTTSQAPAAGPRDFAKAACEHGNEHSCLQCAQACIAEQEATINALRAALAGAPSAGRPAMEKMVDDYAGAVLWEEEYQSEQASKDAESKREALISVLLGAGRPEDQDTADIAANQAELFQARMTIRSQAAELKQWHEAYGPNPPAGRPMTWTRARPDLDAAGLRREIYHELKRSIKDYGYMTYRDIEESFEGDFAGPIDRLLALLLPAPTPASGDTAQADGIPEPCDIKQERDFKRDTAGIEKLLDMDARDQAAPMHYRDCTCLGTCKGKEGLSPGWKCALEPEAAYLARQAPIREAKADPAQGTGET